MERDHDVGTEPLLALDLGYDLGGDLRRDNVVAATLVVCPPHEARAHKVLVLYVQKASRPSDVVHIPAFPQSMLR